MTTTSPVDPTLASLVPLPSRRRNVLVVVGALLAVGVAGWLGAIAGLSVQPRSAAIDLEPDGRIVYAATMAIPRGPGITVQDVRAPEGTTLQGFWVLGDDDPDLMTEPVDLADLTTSLAADRSRSAAPPQRTAGGTLRFAMVLRIDDCSKLTDAAVAGTPDGAGAVLHDGALWAEPSITLRSFVGTTRGVDLEWSGWPEADLRTYSGCD